MATPTGTAAAARQAASGFALRALPRRKTYTTSWDINRRTQPPDDAARQAAGMKDCFGWHVGLVSGATAAGGQRGEQGQGQARQALASVQVSVRPHDLRGELRRLV